jgi:hypothetical protein
VPIPIIITSENENNQSNSSKTISGYIQPNATKAIENINAILRINNSVALIIALIELLSESAKGLYKAALVTPPIPDLNNAIYDKNCEIEDVIPL